MDWWLEPLSSQWQMALLVLSLLMGALVWRAHKQISRFSGWAEVMNEQLARLEEMTQEVSGSTTNTEHTLIANLAEYRMALGSTSAYREYLQKMGIAPAADVEPLLEAIPDGAIAVSRERKVLYVNRAYSESTGITPGMSIDEVVRASDVRTFEGDTLTADRTLEARVLAGERVEGEIVRMRAASGSGDVILSVNGCPARDVTNRVVAAVMIARPISEEVAMAIQVRRMTEASVVPVSPRA
jgi:PAS domain S-box-containing protein